LSDQLANHKEDKNYLGKGRYHGRTMIVRADGGVRMGGGHLMRCLALALAWRSNGGSAIFFSHCESEALRNRIESEGIEFIPVERPWPDSSDLAALQSALFQLKGESDPWVAVDGYHFDSIYLKSLKESGCKLLALDDNGGTDFSYADVVVNQNPHAEMLNYNGLSSTQILLGTNYALLRPEFLEFKGHRRTFAKIGTNILVMLGASDPDNVTGKVIEALKRVAGCGLSLLVVVGHANPYLKDLLKIQTDERVSVTIRASVRNVAPLMAWADLAISGAGSTVFELAYMGLPSILLVLADNQVRVAEWMHERRAAINAGFPRNIEISDLRSIIEKIIYEKETRERMSIVARTMLDGNGPTRIVSALK
jgi:UDP-2,4-diacetamido-2,4,6-trideoxy-beta-L-altropyranose hydrolase